jgi:hypothetical protein
MSCMRLGPEDPDAFVQSLVANLLQMKVSFSYYTSIVTAPDSGSSESGSFNR